LVIYKAEERKMNKFIAFLALFGLVGLISLVVLLSSFVTIESGEVGVLRSFGRVTGKLLNPGLSNKNPFTEDILIYNTKKVVYETSPQDKQAGSKADYKDYPVDTNTSDGQKVDVSYTLRFSVDPTKATDVANTLGDESALVEKIVKQESRVWVRNIVREYKADELYTGNVAEVQIKIEDKIRPTFESNGLILDSLGIREISFSTEYTKAIEQKQIEAVKVETEKNIAEQAKFQKEAKITQAEASAREQELQRATISQELLTKMWIEQWNGVLPGTIMGGDSVNALVQIPQNK